MSVIEMLIKIRLDKRVRRLRLEYDAMCPEHSLWTADWLLFDMPRDMDLSEYERVGATPDDVLRQVCEALKIEAKQ